MSPTPRPPPYPNAKQKKKSKIKTWIIEYGSTGLDVRGIEENERSDLDLIHASAYHMQMPPAGSPLGDERTDEI